MSESNSIIENSIPQFKDNFKLAYKYYQNNGFHIEKDIFSKVDCKKLILESTKFKSYLDNSYIPELQPHNHNNFILSLMKKNNLTSIIKKIISKNKEIYGLQSSFFYGVPGTTGSSQHQDGLWVKPEESNAFISAWIPLIDINNHNIGNLYVYKKSHKAGSLDIVEKKIVNSKYQNEGLIKYESKLNKKYKKIVITANRGSIILLHSNVVHGSLDNLSNKNRYALLLTYIREGCKFRPGNEAKRIKVSLS